MTDNEIIKAFEVCYIDRYGDCSDCPFCNEDMECTSVADNNLLNEVFELINRQKAENERLQTRVGELIRQYNNDIGKVKSEVIKEFAERLKGYAKELKIGDNIYLQVVGAGRIDNLVKEMTENITKVEHDSLCETETYKTREGVKRK